MEKLTSFIAGKWTSSSDHVLKVHHKYTKVELAEVALADDQAIQEVMSSAELGFNELKKWPAQKRSEALLKLAELTEAHGDTLAKLVSAEAGKSLGYARGEIERCQTTLRIAASEALKIAGEVIPMDFAVGIGKIAHTKRFPIGPIFGIVPFNFPLNLAMHKLAPALAAGCSVTLKPSPYTPLSLLYFATLIEQTDLPDGSVNIVVCDNQAAEKLLTSDTFKMFSFTGSPTIGWMLKNKAGKKKVQLELGGNAAVIVDESANIKEAASAIAMGSFLYSGQICISTQRIYIHKEVRAEFVKEIVAAIKNLNVGNPEDEQTIVGPLIADEHLERVDSWVKEAIAEGASILTGGEIVDHEKNLYAPTLLENVSYQSKVHCEEVFGPVAVLETFDNFDDVINHVNQSPYGLQAGLFTNKLDQMKKGFNEIEVGGLIINGIPGFRVDSMPYGGIKDSGLGREGLIYAIEEMTEPRLLVY
jgi:glyceraldehyde-3-phosphate dehydrogenase (NADP+)